MYRIIILLVLTKNNNQMIIIKSFLIFIKEKMKIYKIWIIVSPI